VEPGSLVVTSTPAATVSLDGQARGRTPLTLEDVPPGEHELVLMSDDGRSHREIVEIEAGATLERDQRFPGFGSLSVTSPIWLEVQIDEGPPQQTPVRVPRLTAGTHVVRASRPGYETQVIEIQIEEGEDERLVIELKESPTESP
jgi:hypothetical protein